MDNCLKLRFFGDFTTGENYQLRSEIEAKINILRRFGYDYIFKDTDVLLSKDSFNIVNLESPITSAQKSYLENKKAVLHWMDPVVSPDVLKRHNFNAVSLGNNHTMDWGEEGLKSTIKALNSVDIPFFGAGLNEQSAKAPFKKTFNIENKQINLYIFGGYKYREDYDKEFEFYAKNEKCGVFLMTPDTVCDEIRKIKQEDKNSFVIAFPHFGFNNLPAVPQQVIDSKAYMDAGADYVIGHGPHMINRIEYYKDKPICYSLGNFIFPANFKGRCLSYNLVSEIQLWLENGELKTKEILYPIYSDNNAYAPIARPINESEIDGIVEILSSGNEDVKDKINIVGGELICIEL